MKMAGLLIRRTINTDFDTHEDAQTQAIREELENAMSIERFLGMEEDAVPSIQDFPIILGRPNCFSEDSDNQITITFGQWKTYRRNMNPIVFPSWRRNVAVTGRLTFGTREEVERLVQAYGAVFTTGDRVSALFVGRTKGRGKINNALLFSQRLLPELALYQMVYYQASLHPALMSRTLDLYTLQQAAVNALDWVQMEAEITRAMR